MGVGVARGETCIALNVAPSCSPGNRCSPWDGHRAGWLTELGRFRPRRRGRGSRLGHRILFPGHAGAGGSSATLAPMRPLARTALLLLLLLLPSVSAQEASSLRDAAPPEEVRPRNLILFIADGFGPATRTMARAGKGERLHLDDILVGSVGTTASNSLVTDSASSATAYSAGVKTYNGAIGVDAEGRALRTILEAAEERGMPTGLVSTARITHATPAAFSAHVANRGMEQQIADQQIEQGIDLILGGGRRFYLPREAGGSRRDERNLLDEAREAGYYVVRDRAGFEVTRKLPLLGLFTDSHMSFELDRDPELEPSLAEMTVRAIELLSEAAGENGFFLMVEAGRIDHAGHANDSAAHLRDTLAFDEALGAALAAARRMEDTLLVSVADHETGGLTLGRNIDNAGMYRWDPDFVLGVGSSIEAMGRRLGEGAQPLELLEEAAGITAEDLTEEEAALLAQALGASERQRRTQLAQWMSRVLSRRALTGWTTWGHTGVDIGLFAFGPGSERFRAHHENAAVGRMLADALGLELGLAVEEPGEGE